MDTMLRDNNTNRNLNNPVSDRTNNNDYIKILPKDSIIKIVNPLKPLFDQNKIKEEREKIKAFEKMVEKNKENLLLPIKIQPKTKSIINDNLPPIFTEALKHAKNDLQNYKTVNDSSTKTKIENKKKLHSTNRFSTKKFIKMMSSDNKEEFPKHLPSDNKLENLVDTINTPSKEKEKIVKTKIKGSYKNNVNKKETIFAKEKHNILKNCATFDDWKRKNRVDKDVKVFICFTGYPDMRKALLNRGWKENNDQDSLFFDFKCALSTRNIEHDKLEKFQFINHFENSGEITRKGRLCVNLKNLKWFRDVDIDTFFPRCYDISEINDFDDFIEDFKITKAESILKEYYYDVRNIPEQILETCIQIYERKFLDIDDELDKSQTDFKSITNKEWEIISEEDIVLVSDNENELKPNIENENNKYNGRSKSSSVREISNRFNQNNNINKILSVFKPNSCISQNKKNKNNKNREALINDSKYKAKVKDILDKLKEKNPQYDMNGSRNIWIMKPSGLSRGRGIKCVDTLSEIFKQVKHGLNQFVVQKYIENSLIILNRKFDIRQWVLVTNFNPLTIWLYEEPYIRFGAEDFDLNNIKNLYSHLTNNAIACKSNKFENSTIPGNMWHIGDFKNHLKEAYGKDIYGEIIRPKIKDIIIYSLESVQDLIKNRKHSHEVFGYDLMVDDNFNVWLIEINASPCMEYSTEITKKLVQLVMDDTLKVLFDYPQNSEANTGLWTLIHKSKFVEAPQVPVGFNLVCEGVKLKPSNEI